jgi:MHS family metabolite:H+ symporter-like MFS transporter
MARVGADLLEVVLHQPLSGDWSDPELRHRYLGVAVSREFSAVIAGGLAGVLGAILIAAYHGSWVPLGIYTFVLALITLGSTFITPETQGRDLTRIHDALVDARAGVAVER